jgi:hypothetical protein
MILGRLYTIIFSARVQEIPSLYYDVKRLVERRNKVSRGRGFKGSREKNTDLKTAFAII